MNGFGGADARDGEAPVVMLADGVESRRALCARALVAAGYDVLEVTTLGEALTCWRAAGPDVVVLDVDLDGGAGLTAVSRISAPRPGEPGTALITLSGDQRPDSLVECLHLGAWDHVRAPFDPAELVARVDAVLRLADEHERLRRRNEELEFLGSTDEITGLANRRVVEEELGRHAAAAARHHQALSAVLIAVDRWHDLVARGRKVTDAVLQEVATLIAAIARTGDVAGRFSDDEFLVVLPMTDGDGARVFAERVRAVVAAAPIPTEAGPVDVSLSAGCATGAPGAPELLTRALAALHQAQAAGGDRLVEISS